MAVIATQILAIELIAAVHGGGVVMVVFFYLAGGFFVRQVLQTISGNGTGIDELDGLTLPVGLFNSQPQQVQGAFNINAMRRFRVIFRFGRKDGSQVIDHPNLVFHHQSAQQNLV